MAQLDKASDYESEDWGFESLQGYNFLLHALFSAAGRASGTKNIIPDGIRTHADLRPADLKSAPLDLSGIQAVSL